MHDRCLSVHEIAAHLNVNRDTIYRWIERKQLRAQEVGQLWKVLIAASGARLHQNLLGLKNCGRPPADPTHTK